MRSKTLFLIYLSITYRLMIVNYEINVVYAFLYYLFFRAQCRKFFLLLVISGSVLSSIASDKYRYLGSLYVSWINNSIQQCELLYLFLSNLYCNNSHIGIWNDKLYFLVDYLYTNLVNKSFQIEIFHIAQSYLSQ